MSRLTIRLMLLGPALAAAAVAQGTTRTERQAQRGEQIAQAQCSACHIVAEHQQFMPLLREPAPSFESIANRPDTTEKSLRHFVATTHWDLKTVPITMPDPELSRDDTTAIIRYILTLRRH
jgi:mono/diheme cytochrome c family protein